MSERPRATAGTRSDADLVKAFAPQVRLHPQEAFLPCGIHWLLPQCALYCGDSDRVIRKVGDITQETLLLTPDVDGNRIAGDQPSAFNLQPEKTARAGEPLVDGVCLAACYGHVVERTGCYLDIQFWFLYGFNGFLDHTPHAFGGDHEGDWEHIIIRVSPFARQRTDTGFYKDIIGVFMAAHGHEGGWYIGADEDAKRRRPGTFLLAEGPVAGDKRVVVYSAKSSHASYPFPGTIERFISKEGRIAITLGTALVPVLLAPYTFFLGPLAPVALLLRVLASFATVFLGVYQQAGNDQTAENGPLWPTWKSVVATDNGDTDVTRQPWVHYTGRWGRWHAGKIDWSDCPQSPGLKADWASIDGGPVNPGDCGFMMVGPAGPADDTEIFHDCLGLDAADGFIDIFGARFKGIHAQGGHCLVTLQTVWADTDTGVDRVLPTRGKDHGGPSYTFMLAPGEVVTRISGTLGRHHHKTRIGSLTLITNTGRNSGVIGTAGDRVFAFDVPPGHEFLGFWGSDQSGWIDALGVVFRPHP